MRFTLKYVGSELKSSGNKQPRTEEKQLLRAHWHSQLQQIWDASNVLQFIDRSELREPVSKHDVWDVGDEKVVADMPLKGFMYRRKLHDSWFVPLITPRMEAHCRLAIRLGRPTKPGKLIYEGGDLDGRLKTLFDSLAAPKNEDQVERRDCSLPEYLCLLGDDSLITDLSIESYQLLGETRPNWVDIDAEVTVTAVTPMSGTYSLLFGGP
jgi:hypothetical protein